jgi:hypothetical protein
VLARDSLLEQSPINDAVALAIGRGNEIELRKARSPQGVWMTFDVPLADGGIIKMCDYSSVGEAYKQRMPDLYTSPPKPEMHGKLRVPGIVPPGMEDFRVWLPTTRSESKSP